MLHVLQHRGTATAFRPKFPVDAYHVLENFLKCFAENETTLTKSVEYMVFSHLRQKARRAAVSWVMPNGEKPDFSLPAVRDFARFFKVDEKTWQVDSETAGAAHGSGERKGSAPNTRGSAEREEEHMYL